MTVRTSISSVCPSAFIVQMTSSARFYPMDVVLPTDGFLLCPRSVKLRPHGRGGIFIYLFIFPSTQMLVASAWTHT
jgi:hypothetical protein